MASLRKNLSRILRELTGVFYPRLCASCGISLEEKEEVLCLECYYTLPETNFHLYKDNPLEKLFWGKVPIETAVAYCYYSKKGKMQNIIHKFKYRGHKYIGTYLGREYGKILNKAGNFKKPDVIIPVPLYRKKEIKRGFNQSECFAKGLSESLGIPYNSRIIIRIKDSETQTKKKRYHRWENVKGIFAVREKEELKGKHILLVDDVITTGATIEASAKALLQIPEIRISVAAIAYRWG